MYLPPAQRLQDDRLRPGNRRDVVPKSRSRKRDALDRCECSDVLELCFFPGWAHVTDACPLLPSHYRSARNLSKWEINFRALIFLLTEAASCGECAFSAIRSEQQRTKRKCQQCQRGANKE
jgi:hypothetical protein